MKLLLSLLFTTLILSLGVKGQTFFGNFIPYNTGSCYAQPYGVGYSIQVGKCVSNVGYLEYSTYLSWMLEVNGDELTVNQYSEGDNNCSGGIISTKTFKSGTCNDMVEFVKLNGTIYAQGPFSKAIVTITKSTPSYPNDYLIFETFDNENNGNCDISTLLYATTIGDGNTIDYSDNRNSDSFICQSSKGPYVTHCSDQGYDCKNNYFSTSCNGNKQSFCNNGSN